MPNTPDVVITASSDEYYSNSETIESILRRLTAPDKFPNVNSLEQLKERRLREVEQESGFAIWCSERAGR